jgi:hypothetical protein
VTGSTAPEPIRRANPGSMRPATKPSSENGVSTSPATTTDAPNP